MQACSGYYFLRAGPAAISFVEKVQGLIASQPNPRATEQWAFNAALREPTLSWQMLPLDIFPNGAAYFTHGLRPAGGGLPFVVHNNWLRGASNKEARFRKHAMWLAQGRSCRATATSELHVRDELR